LFLMNMEDIKMALTKSNDSRVGFDKADLLHTGSTLLNMACSGNARGGFLKGTYTFLVGDSTSGKTFLSLTCLAEAAQNPAFKDYRFIYDNAEHGALMNIETFFGRKVADRIEPPALDDDDEDSFSASVEEFYYNVDDAIAEGKPFIYILDSMDSLSSAAEGDKFEEQKKAFRKGTDSAGSYGDGKAKQNSAGIRRLIPKLRDSGSILIVIAQTRDNLGFGFEKKTRSGGHALKFYATLELWSSVKSKIKKKIKGKDRIIGIECQVRIKKNRLTGRDRTVTFPIYYSVGIDDVGSCVDYLIKENHWPRSGNSYNAEDLALKGTKDKIIKGIEDDGMEGELSAAVQTVWEEIENACKVPRKKRYS